MKRSSGGRHAREITRGVFQSLLEYVPCVFTIWILGSLTYHIPRASLEHVSRRCLRRLLRERAHLEHARALHDVKLRPRRVLEDEPRERRALDVLDAPLGVDGFVREARRLEEFIRGDDVERQRARVGRVREHNARVLDVILAQQTGVQLHVVDGGVHRRQRGRELGLSRHLLETPPLL
eukprot:31229-Pelagococcus_subviridis.AAC.2